MRRLMVALVVTSTAFLLLSIAPGARLSGQAVGGPLPPMPIPSDNPQTDAKVKLGAQLFFEPRLSADNKLSCASCHDPDKAWANHDPTDTGFMNRKGNRNSGTVLDSGYMKFQFWDGRAVSLEEQALGPIHNPVEMGETLPNVIRKLKEIPEYRNQFKQVFGTDVNEDGIAKAIAAFERTVVSGTSPYDRYVAGEKTAMSPAAIRGLALFTGKGRCSLCHNDAMLSDQSFHNLGVGMDQKDPDIGREAVTKDPKDRGKFKTPGLRNVALTYPYLHDGSAKTLAEVIALYDRGGVPNPDLDPRMRSIGFTKDEEADLVAFLEALTGPLPKIARPVLPK